MVQAKSPVRSTFTGSYFALPVAEGSDVELAKDHAEQVRKSEEARLLKVAQDKAEERGWGSSWCAFIVPFIVFLIRAADELMLRLRLRRIDQDSQHGTHEVASGRGAESERG